MPILTPYTNITSGSLVTSTAFNNAFTPLYNLVNNVGGLGIDSQNLPPYPQLSFSLINPGAFPSGNLFLYSPPPAGGIVAAANFYNNIFVGPSIPLGMTAGDVSASSGPSSGRLQLGLGSTFAWSDFGATNPGFLTLAYDSVYSKQIYFAPFASTNYVGVAIPCYNSSGTFIDKNFHFIIGTIVIPRPQTTGSVTITGAAQCGSLLNALVVPFPGSTISRLASVSISGQTITWTDQTGSLQPARNFKYLAWGY
jgi:hypothetical protein